MPITVIADVMTLDEAIDLANRTEYGLTAGIYSENEDELQKFFDRIQAGVTYANRRAGATTGAWPGINSVRRLEGQRLDRPRHRRALLRAAVHARTEPRSHPVTVDDTLSRCRNLHFHV